jgi:hypothetical protein
MTSVLNAGNVLAPKATATIAPWPAPPALTHNDNVA